MGLRKSQWCAFCLTYTKYDVFTLFYRSLEEEKKLILTPFERNLEFWRQLWRVIERR